MVSSIHSGRDDRGIEVVERTGIVLDRMLCLTVSAYPSNTARLTAAEYRTASLAAQGLQYKQIVRLLDMSAATIRIQLHAAYRKLGVSNKTGLAVVLASHSSLTLF